MVRKNKKEPLLEVKKRPVSSRMPKTVMAISYGRTTTTIDVTVVK